ncbi:MAG: endonuclease V [Calditrichaeota bacterium]|nr:MAG: endonuclease V [Calditrichota bacterium]
MIIPFEHEWPQTAAEARALQEQLRARLDLNQPLRWDRLRTIAGADISYSCKGTRLYAAVVVLEFPSLKLRSVHTASGPVNFPYLPGYLSFREIPVLLKIFRRLTEDFDVLVCDGHGYAHPRRFGLACHLATLLGKPAVGCAKSRLIGQYQEPAWERGSFQVLYSDQEQIGWVLRTRTGVKPIFVSPGNFITFEDALRLALQASPRYRVPEPIRQAHLQVNQLRLREETQVPHAAIQ